MNAQFDLTDSSNLSAKKRTGKASWKVGRILYLALVLIGTIVAYFLPSLPYQPPLCLFKLMTGFPCAGCGMTRAFEAAARGRFREAFEWHPIVGGRGSCRAKTAASSEWRIANGFSGGQCSCTAENFRRIRRCALQFFSLLQQASFL
jgi:hypothetical protein